MKRKRKRSIACWIFGHDWVGVFLDRWCVRCNKHEKRRVVDKAACRAAWVESDD